jgi:hypothetical protein
MKTARLVLAVLLLALMALPVFAQGKLTKVERRPPAVPASDAPAKSQPQDWDGSVWVLDGMPMLFDLHHDTEVGTNKPIDVYVLVIEMQIMNSDGNLEPVGLQIHNFFTATPQDRRNDINPHNARDCKAWSKIIQQKLRHHDPKSRTWPYIELLTNSNARVIQTNEDGQVWYSDDVECWGSSDRFRPF